MVTFLVYTADMVR